MASYFSRKIIVKLGTDIASSHNYYNGNVPPIDEKLEEFAKSFKEQLNIGQYEDEDVEKIEAFKVHLQNTCDR